jgi:hypothetical protein
MASLENILFDNGDFNEKKSYIERMAPIELMSVNKSVIKSIVEKCDKNGRMWISPKLRVGNHWNSLVEAVDLIDGNVYLIIYIQNTKTDTSTSEKFDTFFRSGKYYSCDNNLKEAVGYSEKAKAEVMRSILMECVCRLFSDEEKKKKLIAELVNYSIITPILNKFYDEFNLKYNTISKYSSGQDLVKNKGYHYGDKKIREYIEGHCFELEGKSKEELKTIYEKVFMEAYNEFDKSFDYNKWRSECTLWY